MLSDTERQAAIEFVYREARLADEARYAEWHALWTDDAVYWVPATTDPAADPERHLSHIYDNRARLDTRVKLLQTGHRYSQEPASLMRRLSPTSRSSALRTAIWWSPRTSSWPSSPSRRSTRCTGGSAGPRTGCAESTAR